MPTHFNPLLVQARKFIGVEMQMLFSIAFHIRPFVEARAAYHKISMEDEIGGYIGPFNMFFFVGDK